MSLGGGLFSGTCDTGQGASQKPAIDALRGAGVLTAVASGNDGSKSQISTPACISTAVAVGATTKQDQISSFSNISSAVDLLAPGSSIQSSVPQLVVGVNNNTTTACLQAGNGSAVAMATNIEPVRNCAAALGTKGI